MMLSLAYTYTTDRNQLEERKNPIIKRLKESLFLKNKIGKEDTSKFKNPISLVGYTRRSENNEVIRLYPSLEFDQYFDISNNDIVHMEGLQDNTIEFGGTRILLKNDAFIKHIKLDVSKKQASFLEGKVVSERSLNLGSWAKGFDAYNTDLEK